MLPQNSLTNIVLLIVAMLVSLTVHEFVHALVAHKLGDDTAFEGGRVSFNPLRHIDLFSTIILPIITIVLFGIPLLAAKPVPFNPYKLKFGDYGSALVAAAGPVSNLVMAYLAAWLAQPMAVASHLYTFLSIFITLNVIIFVFNLIPIPPLDGSRVLYAFAPDGVRRVFNMIEPYGIIIVFALVLFGGFGGALVRIEDAILSVFP